MPQITYQFHNNLWSFGHFEIPILFFIGVFILSLFAKRNLLTLRNMSGNPNSFIGFSYFVVSLIAILMTVSAVENQRLYNELLAKTPPKIIEGNIDNFEPLSSTGKGVESFEVESVYFSYSRFSGQKFGFTGDGSSFSDTSKKYRITYITHNGANKIIKMELLK